jgi:hypothetical protein
MTRLPKHNAPKLSVKSIIGFFFVAIIIIILFMLREIFPNNPFIMKYFNKGYLFAELIIFFGILWGIASLIKRKKEDNNRG